MKPAKICLTLFLTLWVYEAQSFRLLRGEIRGDRAVDLSWLMVQLDTRGQNHGDTATVGAGGEFAFLNVPEGLYTLRVINRTGDELLSQPITVSAANPSISLQLPKQPDEHPTGETASVAQLRHRPSRVALAAARRAQKWSESGDYERSAIEWRKAVEADPDFSEAHGNLGAQYARLNRDAEAAEEFRRAIALDPYTARHQSNLAIVLAQLGQYNEAESWARTAVRREDSSPLGHYVLGCVLTSRGDKIGEAIQQLQIAARQIPRAHEALAKIYDAEGRKALAVAERKQFQEAESAASPLH